MNLLFTVCILLLSSFGVFGENQIQTTTYNYSKDLLNEAFLLGDWKAGNNLGVSYLESENGANFSMAARILEKSAIFFMKIYDKDNNGLLNQAEYNDIPKDARKKYPALFYNLGHIFIQKQDWDSAAQNLKVAADSGIDSVVKSKARHDYSILFLKNKKKKPKGFLKIIDGITFEEKKSTLSFSNEKAELNLSDSLKVLSQNELPQIAEVAKRNLRQYEMYELIRVFSDALHQNKINEIYNVSAKLANEFSRLDLALQGIIYIIYKQPKDAKYIGYILKEFPDELNYSYYIFYSKKALTEDPNLHYKAKQFNEKVNFSKLDPDFKNKLDECLPKPQIVATQKIIRNPTKRKVQRSIYDKSAYSTVGDRENKLLEFYNSYVKTPPSNLDQCKGAVNWITKNKLIDDTGEAEFYLFRMWKAYYEKHGKKGSMPSLSKNKKSKYFNDAHMKNYPDAIWLHYCESNTNIDSFLNYIFQKIKHKEIDGSPKSIFEDILKSHFVETKNKFYTNDDKDDLLDFVKPYFDRKKDIEEAFMNSSYMNSERSELIKTFQKYYQDNK